MNVGEFSTEEPATPDIKDIANQVKDQLEKKTGKRFDIFKANSFREKRVLGMMYLVKVHYGDKGREYAHLKIYKAEPAFDEVVILISYCMDKPNADPLVPF